MSAARDRDVRVTRAAAHDSRPRWARWMVLSNDPECGCLVVEAWTATRLGARWKRAAVEHEHSLEASGIGV